MKWEYKTLKLKTEGIFGGKINETKLDNFMNQLGDEGWELVTSFSTSQSFGESRDVVVIFKREKT